MPAEVVAFATVVVVLAIFGLLIRHGIRMKKETGQLWQRLEAEAAPLGYRPAPAEAGRLGDALRTGPRFRSTDLEVLNLLGKPGRGSHRYLVEYRTSSRSSGSSAERGTLFTIRFDDRRLPRFVLHHSPVRLPKLIAAGLDRLVQVRYPGFERVPLTTVSPALANSLMYAASRDEGTRTLTADVVEVLGRSAGWGLESTGDWLIADKQTQTRSRSGDPSTVMAELAEFDAIADAFER